jgi:putative tryptophan/tyrosine transport system substrate-binding protein
MRRREFIRLLGGSVAALLIPTRAQTAMPLIGFMSGRAPEESKYLLAAFHQGLGEAGFIEGKNVTIEYRWAFGDYGRLPAMASELVKRNVAVLVALGGDLSGLAAKRATSTIPIVFSFGGDPVEAGVAASLSKPGGNATGYMLLTNAMEPKRLGILHDLVPKAEVIGVLLNPNFPPAVKQLSVLENAARAIDQRLAVFRASNDAELDACFRSLVEQHVSAMLVTGDPYFDTQRARIVAFATQNRLPAIYHFREYAIAGGLISYGPRVIDGYRQAGIYTGQILNGAKPGELPIVQPTKYEFVVNLKTAKAIGMNIPSGLISFADEVIE